MSTWNRANKENGLSFAKVGGEWQYQGSGAFTPLASSKGLRSTALIVNAKKLGHVATYTQVSNDTMAVGEISSGTVGERRAAFLEAYLCTKEDPDVRERLRAHFRRRLRLAVGVQRQQRWIRLTPATCVIRACAPCR